MSGEDTGQICRPPSKAATSTENRRRFVAARHSLGWSISRTAREIEVDTKLLECWLYDRGRDVPRLAVLLIEARVQLAAIKHTTAHGKRFYATAERKLSVITGLQNGKTITEIAEELGVSKQRISQIAKAADIKPWDRRKAERQASAAEKITKRQTVDQRRAK